MTTRRWILVVVISVIAAGVVAVGYAVLSKPRSATTPTTPLRSETATVTRGVATERLQVSGTLGFEGSHPVIHQGPARILTSVAPQGTVIELGGVLYAVANQPTRLLFGAVPAYREFAAGMSDGPDVRQLEEGLAALGFNPRGRMVVNEHFDCETTEAIKRWEASWGLPPNQRTGKLPLGRVVFLPAAVRAGASEAKVGGTLSPETVVYTATSTRRVVTANVGADRQATVHQDDQVLVSLPGMDPFPGKVTSIGQVTQAADQNGTTPAPSGPPTVPVTIAVDLPPNAQALGETPVRVAITTASRPDVLLVPVTALLAKPGGGYQLRMGSGELVTVQPGLFDDATGTAEVSGQGLEAGQTVQVPSS